MIFGGTFQRKASPDPPQKLLRNLFSEHMQGGQMGSGAPLERDGRRERKAVFESLLSRTAFPVLTPADLPTANRIPRFAAASSATARERVQKVLRGCPSGTDQGAVLTERGGTPTALKALTICMGTLLQKRPHSRLQSEILEDTVVDPAGAVVGARGHNQGVPAVGDKPDLE